MFLFLYFELDVQPRFNAINDWLVKILVVVCREGEGWNYRFYSYIEYTIYILFLFFRRLEGDNYGIFIEIFSYYDCSHAEILFFLCLYTYCVLFYIHSKLGGWLNIQLVSSTPLFHLYRQPIIYGLWKFYCCYHHYLTCFDIIKTFHYVVKQL